MAKFSFLVCIAVSAVLVLGEPLEPPKPNVTIVHQSQEVDPTGYSFEYLLSDGTSRQEQGIDKNDTDGLSVRGSFNYLDPEGKNISVTYLADKNGFQPKSDSGSSSNSSPTKSSPNNLPNNPPKSPPTNSPSTNSPTTVPPTTAP